ncbi:PREDICTED: pyrroline-5-carboxylate reductase 2-like [Priapulus caudatus]|uniref:pyrroline-5-carboxylate reductase n=1 Tax=Priapulus caudatus TaxID=37621 RepID=A0ABM1DYY7_PRICU|nr:PREDICTED: pyrroline-5-carboxylate reductase 2-like [Priapulus caudatus]
MRIGFIGAGKVAQAITKGLIDSGITAAENIIASSPKQDHLLLTQISKLGVGTTFNNKTVVKESDVVVVCTKPNVVSRVLTEFSSDVSKSHLIISVALGVTTKTMEKALPKNTRVVRVMPNTPALVRMSASVYCMGSSVIETDAETVSKLLTSFGYCEEISESLIDIATGLSGSGPAYVFTAIQSLADGAVKMGMPRDQALRLAAYAVMGSAKLVLESGQHPDSLKDDVCSPAGCTIYAMHLLEKRGFRAALIDAVEVATLRTKELGDFKV